MMKKGTSSSRYIPVDLREGCWTLTKENDEDFLKQCSEIRWIEWDDTGKMKAEWKNLEMGRSLFMDPLGLSYNWITSPIIEVITEEEKLIEFKTQNSHYILEYDKGTI